MAGYWNRKRSFRELRRFTAADQTGMQHTVVQRVETLQSVGVTSCVIEAQYGASVFYSATSGDALVLQADGSFCTGNGKPTLRADAEDIAEIIIANQCK